MSLTQFVTALNRKLIIEAELLSPEHPLDMLSSHEEKQQQKSQKANYSDHEDNNPTKRLLDHRLHF